SQAAACTRAGPPVPGSRPADEGERRRGLRRGPLAPDRAAQQPPERRERARPRGHADRRAPARVRFPAGPRGTGGRAGQPAGGGRRAVGATAALRADVRERLASKHEIAYLLTRPDRPRGRGRRGGAPPAKETAERLELEVHQPERVGADFDPGEDVVVVAAYG